MKNLIAVIFLVFFLVPIFGQNLQSDAEHALGEVVIRLNSEDLVENFIENFNLSKKGFQLRYKKEVVKDWNLHLFHLEPANFPVEIAAEILNQNPEVDHAFADRFVTERNDPDDPSFPRQWGLERIDVQSVWQRTTGGTTVQRDEIVVAVIDSGFDTDHPDLVNNLWENPGEIPNDGIDTVSYTHLTLPTTPYV